MKLEKVKWIPEDAYDKLFQSFNEKKVGLETRLALLNEAEDNYYITAKYLLDIANRAYDVCIRSEVEEKRQLVKLTLQNLRLEGKLVRYDALKPFDTILIYNDNQLGLREVEGVRTYQSLV